MAQLPPPYLNINGDSNLVRDTRSMGILNVNTSALRQAKLRQEQALNRLAEERSKTAAINTLRTEVDELKRMVTLLLKERE